jgi:polysaccharide chain length determinant protein (PEP-CTERM system associated)
MPEIESSPSDTLTLQRVRGIIVRGRWWILLTATVVTLATVASLYQIPNRYTSEATLLVVPQQVPARYVTPTTETNIADALQAMTQDVLSRARLLELIDEFGLYAKERQRLPPEEVLELMRKYIDIKPADPTPGRKDINSFKISFVAEKAALAQQVTSKLTSFFIQANLKTREDQATNTTNFLQAQLDSAKNKLTVQEAKMRDFKAQYLGELPEQLQGNLAIFNGAQLQLQNLEGSLDRAQQQRVYLESLISGYQRLAAAHGVTAGGIPGLYNYARQPTPLQTAQSDLTRLQASRAQLVSIYKPAHPSVVAIDREISAEQAVVESLRISGNSKADNARESALTPPATTPTTTTASAEVEDDSSVTQLKSQLEANRLDIENLTKAEAQQKAVISQYQNRLNLTPVREQQLAGILRDAELAKQDYADLLGKEQQSQLAMSLEKQQGGQQFRLVEPPSLPDLPSSPQRIKFSLMGVGAGLFLGLVIAFVSDLARPTLHTMREVSQRFGAPLVIGLPVVFTQYEKRRRNWKMTFQWMGGSVLALVIGAAEFYVLRHP